MLLGVWVWDAVIDGVGVCVKVGLAVILGVGVGLVPTVGVGVGVGVVVGVGIINVITAFAIAFILNLPLFTLIDIV